MKLTFLFDYLKDCNIPYTITKGDGLDLSMLDLGLRNTFFNNTQEQTTKLISALKEHTIYHIFDYYNCVYSFFLLNDSEFLFVGPYLLEPINDPNIITLINSLNMPQALFTQLKDYYQSLPLIYDRRSFHLLLQHTYAHFKEISDVKVEYIDLKQLETTDQYLNNHQFKIDDDPILSMQILEKRYMYEDLLLDAVSLGNTTKALSFIDGLISYYTSPNNTIELRKLKNIMLIFNTLLRRCTYQAGVHPFYIDKVSSNYGIIIEETDNQKDLLYLGVELIKTYCNLVNTHSTANYSQPIRHILVTIEASLTTDLTLKRFANELFLNTSYLSALFKKEVGMTLTEYVNKSRIEYAKKLLKSTSLSIQNIAIQSGISDIHYFTRLFTRETGVSPKVWRNQ